MKILMVCLGNICRSPLADGLLREKVKDFKDEITVDSAGTSGQHAGEAPDSRMIATAKSHGLDISTLTSRQIQKSDLDEFDVIYVMDKQNLENVKKLQSPDNAHKIKMILNETFPSENREVPDPYFGGQDGFENVYQLLDEATTKIFQDIKAKL